MNHSGTAHSPISISSSPVSDHYEINNASHTSRFPSPTIPSPTNTSNEQSRTPSSSAKFAQGAGRSHRPLERWIEDAIGDYHDYTPDAYGMPQPRPPKFQYAWAAPLDLDAIEPDAKANGGNPDNLDMEGCDEPVQSVEMDRPDVAPFAAEFNPRRKCRCGRGMWGERVLCEQGHLAGMMVLARDMNNMSEPGSPDGIYFSSSGHRLGDSDGNASSRSGEMADSDAIDMTVEGGPVENEVNAEIWSQTAPVSPTYNIAAATPPQGYTYYNITTTPLQPQSSPYYEPTSPPFTTPNSPLWKPTSPTQHQTLPTWEITGLPGPLLGPPHGELFPPESSQNRLHYEPTIPEQGGVCPHWIPISDSSFGRGLTTIARDTPIHLTTPRSSPRFMPKSPGYRVEELAEGLQFGTTTMRSIERYAEDLTMPPPTVIRQRSTIATDQDLERLSPTIIGRRGLLEREGNAAMTWGTAGPGYTRYYCTG